MEKTGAQILVECLLEQEVDTVFGFPGGAVLNIYDALYEYSDRVRHVLTAHEQGASHAADGYARATGKTGVVIATSGPGATNLVTGLATAYMDSVPVVAITGNVAVPLLGRDSFQEVDITGITMPVTKHNYIVKDIADISRVVREAFVIASSGRKGPVLIDIPKDVTAAKTDYTPAKKVSPRPAPAVNHERICKAAALLANAQRPLIYAGGGVISADASQQLRRLAASRNIPVAQSMMALGAIENEHPLNLGLIGMHGSYHANRASDECDVMLVAGARFSDRVAGDREGFASGKTIIHMDIDKAEFDKNVLSELHICGDLKETLAALCDALPPGDGNPGWLKQIEEYPVKWVQNPPEETANPYDVIKMVSELCPGALVATDVGQHQMWVAQHYPFYEPRQLLTSGGLGTMGFGLGAAIGAQVAFPEKRVALFSGDGSFHMNLNELTTLASYDLPVVVIVMNNTVLGMVRQWQKAFYGNRFSQTDPRRKTDFVKVAQAFGVHGLRIEKAEETREILERAFALESPVVVDCRISPDVNVLPMIPPGGGFGQIVLDM